HLYESSQDGGLRPCAGDHHALRLLDGGDGALEPLALLFQRGTLGAQRLRHGEGTALEQTSDPPQRQTERLERHDLLQPLEVLLDVETVAGLAPTRPEQTQPFVVPQRLGRDPGQCRELLYPMLLAQATSRGPW